MNNEQRSEKLDLEYYTEYAAEMDAEIAVFAEEAALAEAEALAAKKALEPALEAEAVEEDHVEVLDLIKDLEEAPSKDGCASCIFGLKSGDTYACLKTKEAVAADYHCDDYKPTATQLQHPNRVEIEIKKIDEVEVREEK